MPGTLLSEIFRTASGGVVLNALSEEYNTITKCVEINPDVLNILNSENAKEIEHRLTTEELFADAIISKHNQHVIVLLVGKTGEGKSRTALHIAVKAAKYIASKLGGNWTDYFTVDHVAIITREEIIRVVKNNKKKNVVVLDDIGVGWSNREWQEKGNKILNRMIMTFRNMNNLLIMTVPDSFLLDKVPRNLLHLHLEMYQQHFDDGISIYKPYTVKKNYRTEKTYYAHPVKDGVKYVAAVTNTKDIPQEIVDEYESRRSRIQEEMESEDTEAFEELLQQNDLFKSKMEEVNNLKTKLRIQKSINVYNRVQKGTPVKDALRIEEVKERTYYNHLKKYPDEFN